MSRRLRVRLLGTGSSGGVPRVDGDWGLCDPAEPRNRRTRCSILLKCGPEGGPTTDVLVDTSPDMREQLIAAGQTRLDAAVYTHEHADQTHGMDDLRGFVLLQRKLMPVHMDPGTARSLTERFNYCFVGRGGYPAIFELHQDVQHGRPVRIEGPGGVLELLALELDHGGLKCFGYRVGGFAYCNDVKVIPDKTFDLLHDLDVLVVDALRPRPHPTHAHLELALEWIDRIRPRRAILTNLHNDMDYASLTGSLPIGVEPAYDGLEIDFDLP